MTCVGCAALVPDEARFCPECGARQPEEDPAAVAEYEATFSALAGRDEPWAEAELTALRAELRIRASTHQRLLASLRPRDPAPVSAWFDARAIADFRANEQCLLRIRVVNEGPRALADLALRLTTTAAAGAFEDRAGRALGPGEEAVLSALFRPSVAGHHHAAVQLLTVPLRGAERRWSSPPVPFLVGASQALQSQIHIDARSQRVGIFENIGGPAKGGLVERAEWRRLELSPAEAPSESPPPEDRTPASGIATVIAAGDLPLVEVGGHRGPLVDWRDGPLAPGDRIQVAAIGQDAAGRPLWSARASSPPSPAPPSSLEIGPGDDLAAALASAPAGARLSVRGIHQGPLRIERPLELTGIDGAILESPQGPALRIAADAVLRGLTVRGSAPAGRYAADAVEIRAGRAALEGCTLSSDAPGNLTPGRALAVCGPASVELRGCTIRDSGVGLAIDVSWSGFPTDTARGARVRVLGGTFEGLGIGAAVAGADRELSVARARFERIADRAVQVHKGAAATVEDCVLGGAAAEADSGATLVARRNT